jgi:hypothetical protein
LGHVCSIKLGVGGSKCCMAANALIMTFESISFLSWGGCHMSTWVLHDAEMMLQ